MSHTTVRLPRGYTAHDNMPWFEADDTHLELILHRRGRVTWRIVQTSTGAPHPGFESRRWGWRRPIRRTRR